MKKYLFVLLSSLLFGSIACSQSNKLDKKMEKAQDLVQKGKIKEAGEYMDEFLAENPYYGRGWDYLAKIRYKEYKDSKETSALMGKLTVTAKDKDGKEKANDSLANSLLELLNSIDPSKVAYSKYIYTLRKATLVSNDAYMANIRLRNLYVDIDVDTAINKKALKHFKNAEEEFGAKNYEIAAKLYRRALDEQPGFYKANMYMGDCFYFTENYTEALSAFKEATEKFPDFIEPRKYLVDTYQKMHLYDKMLEESITGMSIYPDYVVADKLEDAAYALEKKLDFKWMPRAVFPNKINTDTTGKARLNEYQEKNVPAPDDPWRHYVAAHGEIKNYCDKNGIITKKNSLTSGKYLELYSWEQMLKNSTDPSLENVRKIQKDGYLDCYVLVTCYHFDFYEQYAHFAKNNKEKITEYYKKYLVAYK